MEKMFYHGKFKCIVFPMLETTVLNAMLRENDDEKILLLFGQIRLLALEMIVGFNYIHDISLIHTDIKIDNVMIVKFLYSDTDLGENVFLRTFHDTDIRIIDYGLMEDAVEGIPHGRLFSKPYMSPELLATSSRSYPLDVFALGCLLAELQLNDILLNLDGQNNYSPKEHFTIMEQALGPMPSKIRNANDLSKSFFASDGEKTVHHSGEYSKTLRMRLEDNAKFRDKYLTGENKDEINMRKRYEDLLHKMLEHDPYKRITLDEALNHPFFEGMQPLENPLKSWVGKNYPDGNLNWEVNDVLLKEKYKIKRLLRRERFGNIFEVEDIQNTDPSKKMFLKIAKYGHRNKMIAENEARTLGFHLDHLDGLNYEDGDDELFVEMIEHFNYDGHVCIVYEGFGQTVGSFMVANQNLPFPIAHIRNFAYQLCDALIYLRDKLGMTHTDIKLESLLLEKSIDYCRKKITIEYQHFLNIHPFKLNDIKTVRQLKNTIVRLTDFYAAIYNGDLYNENVITPWNRPPEVILGLDGLEKIPVWQIGILLWVALTGHHPFHKHETEEYSTEKHLANIEDFLGISIPKEMRHEKPELFNESGKVKYQRSGKLDTFLSLKQTLIDAQSGANPNQQGDTNPKQKTIELLDLISQALQCDPAKRISIHDMFKHPFVVKKT